MGTTLYEQQLDRERAARIAAHEAAQREEAARREREQAARRAENDRLRAARLAKLDADRAAKRQADEAASVAAVKATHRAAFLAVPGTTPEQFEAAWPELLREWQADQLRHGFAREKAALAQSGRYRM